MMKIVTLSNGKRVGNFSSPHPFTFTDGNVLPAVDEKKSILLSVSFLEFLHSNGDVSLGFALPLPVWEEMRRWREMHDQGLVDVVFCPLPMITSLKEQYEYKLKESPFRTVRIEDRINKLVSIEKQCI